MMGAPGDEEPTGAMWKATIRGLLARRVRLVLTAMAVLLGVAFVSATYVLTDTVKRAFDGVFTQTLVGVDLQVQGLRELDRGDPPRIPERTLEEVRAVPGVARAEGFVTGYAQFVGRDGESIGGGGPPTFGVSWVDDGPFRLVDDGASRPPRRAGEVAMDAATARENGFTVGDRVRVLLRGPARAYRIVGLFGFGERDDFGAVTFAAFDLSTAQRVFDAPQALDRIYVQRDPDVTVRELQARLERALGGRYDVLTAPEAARQVAETVRTFLSFFTYALLGFAAIGVVVGAFVIFNTFTILVTQRTRELGLLRAMGATGRQVVWSVVLEAVVVGAVASVLGLAVGIGLGVGLLALLRGIGLELPETSTVLLARTVFVSLAVGVIVTVVAAVLPAVRAARVPPVAAINDVQLRVHGSFRRRVISGVAVTIVSATVLGYGLVRAEEVTGVFDQVQVVALGAFGVLVGVVMLLATVARPLAGAVGWPLRALGPSGRLARANAMRNPRRTAVTASALVIGLALVGLTATFGESAKASVRRDVGAGLRADYVVKTDGFASFSTEVATRLGSLPDVAAAVPLRFVDGAIGDDVQTVGGVDVRALTRVVDLDFVRGGAQGLEDGGVLVDDETAERHGLRVGGQVMVQFSRGSLPLLVRGIYRNENFIGIFGQSIPMLVAREVVGAAAGASQDYAVLVKAKPGRAEAAGDAMKRALEEEFPNIQVLTREEFRTEQQQLVDQFLTVLVAILALSALIAILGIVNTLALSVYERTHELGLLRVVGMSQREVRRMVRWESVVIAVVGALVGVALGVLWGWAFARALRDQGLSVFRIPTVQVALFLVAAIVAGVVAAVFPAWRASRLDVLDAIATE
jgi:putative ABC transport system permease protein